MNIRSFLQSSLGWSRRKADSFIKEHGVLVGKKLVKTPWTDVNPGTQDIHVGGEKVKPKTKQIYIAFHKPTGIICSHKRQGPVKTIFDLLPREFNRLRFSGRLDKNSRGLVVLSTDGYFLQYLSRPEFGFIRQYLVTVKGQFDSQRLHKLSKKGWEKDGELFRPFTYKILTSHKIKIYLTEGKKREIRLLFETLKTEVTDLLKLEHGPIRLGKLRQGQWRYLEPEIVKKIKRGRASLYA